MTAATRLQNANTALQRKERKALNGWTPSEEGGLVIDPEFEALIPPLLTEDLDALEASLLAEGCRDALVVWVNDGKQILVDGHNRYRLCQRHDIAFEIVEHTFDSREDVMLWMLRNQRARRNLNAYMRGLMANKEKDILSAIYRRNSGKRTDLISAENLSHDRAKGSDAWEDAAKNNDTSRRTMSSVAYVEKNAPDSIKEKARAGDIAPRRAEEITKAYTSASPAVQSAVEQYSITDPQLVALLETKKDTDTVQSLFASGVIQTGEDEDTKPLSEATAWDVQGMLRKAEKEHRRTAADGRLADKHAQIQTAPAGIYSVIYADPPWSYDNSGLYGSAATIYPTMPIEAICGYFAQINVQAQDDAVLFLWATNPLLQEALAVMTAWDFAYKTNIAWDKETPTTGLGFYVKGQHELLLIGTRGSFRPNFMPPSVLRDRKGDHSRKPASVYSLIETMYPQQRYLELFARAASPREDWTFFGGEA